MLSKEDALKDSDQAMRAHSESLIQLHEEIAQAIQRYFQRGLINFATVVGVIEGHKLKVIEIGKLHSEWLQYQEVKEPPSYVG